MARWASKRLPEYENSIKAKTQELKKEGENAMHKDFFGDYPHLFYHRGFPRSVGSHLRDLDDLMQM